MFKPLGELLAALFNCSLGRDRLISEGLVELHVRMVGVAEHADRVPTEVRDVLHLEVLIDLPESRVVVLQESLVDHLLLVSLAESLRDLISVAHLEAHRFLQGHHKVEVISLLTACKVLADWISFVVEREAPRDLFFLAREPHCGIELHADWDVPSKWLPVELKVHLVVCLKLVLRGVLVE